MKKAAMSLAVFSLLLFTACVKEINPNINFPTKNEEAIVSEKNTASASSNTSFTSGEILVKFKREYSEKEHNNAFEKVGGKSIEKIITKAMKKYGDEEGFYVLSTSLEVLDAIAKMKQLPEIEYAEPNFIYSHFATSNDPYYTNGNLWGMYGDASSPANQYGSQAAEAWAAGHTGSSSVYVGIIDEGVMNTHQDLSANIFVNVYDPVDKKDNDGNGYIDDVRGWNFANNNNSTYGGTSDDHGTHVAGTVGAKGGNGVGVAGICWNVKIITAKFLGPLGGTTANAIKAIDYITDLKTRHGLNIVATNNSWGGGGFSQALQDAIERANAANILFIAAAGNGGSDGVGDNNDLIDNYPSNYPNDNIIAVAAITSSGARSSFSNYGPLKVDIGAPGSGIYSTLPSRKGSGTYGSYNGTSMATPHVTGAAALYAASHPGASASEIKNAILNNAVPTASLNGHLVSNGRLNVSGF
ncbi:MAG: S8 family peptidase [Chitinophagaceae bacterium]